MILLVFIVIKTEAFTEDVGSVLTARTLLISVLEVCFDELGEMSDSLWCW